MSSSHDRVLANRPEQAPGKKNIRVKVRCSMRVQYAPQRPVSQRLRRTMSISRFTVIWVTDAGRLNPWSCLPHGAPGLFSKPRVRNGPGSGHNDTELGHSHRCGPRASARMSVAPRKRKSATKMRPVVKGHLRTYAFIRKLHAGLAAGRYRLRSCPHVWCFMLPAADQAGNRRAEDGRKPEQPELRDVGSASKQRRTGASRRVDRSVGDRDQEEVNER